VTGHSNGAHNGPIPPPASFTPLRDQQTPLGPKGPPAKTDPRGPLVASRVGMQWGEKGPLHMGPKPSREVMPAFRRGEPTFGLLIGQREPMCWGASARQLSDPLDLASLGLGLPAFSRLPQIEVGKNPIRDCQV
jgi:hypothetical protein